MTTTLKQLYNITCLLYADDLVFWRETPKINAKSKTENILTTALKILSNCRHENGMELNASKTTFQSLSPAHQSINPELKYNGSIIQQTGKSTYLGVTFDN